MSNAKLMTPPSPLDGVEFVDDNGALSILNQNGVTFSVETVNLGDVDVKGSIDRNNRLRRKYDKERVEDIARQMLSGGTCLRLVGIWIPEKGHAGRGKPRLVVDLLGGNHRCGALLLNGRHRAQVYIIETADDMVVTRLRNNLNNMTGLGNDKQTMLANAHTEYMSRGGVALTSKVIDEIAEVYHLKPSALKAYVSVEGVKQIVEGHNLKLDRLKDVHYRLLGQLRTNHKVLVDTAKAANVAEMSTEAIRDLVHTVRAERGGEAKQLVALRKWVETYRLHKAAASSTAKRTVSVRRTNFDQLTANIRRLLNFFEKINPSRPNHVDNTTPETDAEIKRMFAKMDEYRRKITRKKR